MGVTIKFTAGILSMAIGLFLFACSSPAAEDVAIEELPTEPLRSGDAAPDFTLPDGDGNLVSLADHLLNNQLVVLVFYEEFT